MTTDELLMALPSALGDMPIIKNGEIIAYDGRGNYQHLQLLNDGRCWCASYGKRGEYICLGQNANGTYKNLFGYGITPNEALQELYNTLIKYEVLDSKR